MSQHSCSRRATTRTESGAIFHDRRMTVFDVRITDTDSASSQRVSPRVCLGRHEEEKVKKYKDACTQMRRDFVPLVFSVDGMQGSMAAAAVKRLAALLAKSWSTPYSVTCGYVRSRLSLCLVRSLTMCLRDPRDPTSTVSEPTILDGAGLQAYEL